MSRSLILFLLAVISTTWEAPIFAQQTKVEVDPGFTEQVNQLTDNFEALQNSFVQGQEKLTELEEKLAKLKANKSLMRDPRVQSALQKLEKAGLSKKLANSKTILSGFENGGKNISSGASDAIEKYEKIKGYYDRWNPNSDSPTRPLELVGNSLEELQSIIYTLDPTPDNLLTKPLGEFIGFYKDATQAFVGALNRTQTAINNRRQNCIGQGCGLGSIAGSKDADFIALGTGDTIRLIREIRPAIGPVGELWGTGDGTIYMYQISTNGVSGIEFVTRTTGQWFTMQCGIGQFNDLYRGMRLAYGEVATVPTLISRCNQDFSAYTEATKRAEKYWNLLNPSRDDEFCTTKLVGRRGFPGEPKNTLEKANNDRAQFIAMYTYKPSMRQSVDRLVPVFSGSIFLEGIINLSGDEVVSSGSIAVTLLGRSGSASMGADRRFEIDLPVNADADRRVGKLRFSTPGFDDYETDIAIDGACANLGTINVVLKSENNVDYSQHENALREMRSLVTQAEAIRQQGFAKISNLENAIGTLDGDIAKLKASADRLANSNTSTGTGAGNNMAAVDQLKLLERQAFAIAQRLADIRQTIRQKSGEICQSYDRIKSAFDIQSVDAIYSEVPVAKSTVDSLMAEYRSLLAQLEQLKGQALSIHSGDGSAEATGAQNVSFDALQSEIDQVGNQISLTEDQMAELQASKTQLAGLISRGQGILATITSLNPTPYGQKGDDLLTQIQASFGQIDAYRDEVIARSNSLDGMVSARKTALSNVRQILASAKQNTGSGSAAVKSAEKSNKDIALNSFNASHDTALIYTDAIESSANSARYCNDSALAMYNHRHELDQLASDTAPPAETENEPPTEVAETPPSTNPEPPVEIVETNPASDPEPPVEVVETPAEPRSPAQPPQERAPVVVAENDPEPVDPCNTKKVLGLFGKADRALDRENIGSWRSAAQKITSRGCQNGRLEASIARANAIVDQKNRERETAERIAAVEDRMPEPPKKPRGRGLGNLLGAIGTVVGAVNSGRGQSSGANDIGGVLGSIFGAGNSQRQTTPQTVPQAPRSTPRANNNGTFDRGSTSGGLGALGNAGVVTDRQRAGAIAGSVGGSRSSGNACTALQSKITGVAQHMNRAAAARNIDKLRELTRERDRLFDQVCRANCDYPVAAYCVKKIR
ncbi:MAG: hypothetical protein Pars2KO_31140 [Parasphingorhabdus sp.]